MRRARGRHVTRGPLAFPVWTVLAAVVLLGLSSLAGCSTGSGSRRTLMVSAAASLTDVFADLREGFVAEHPDVDVQFNFGSSASLAAQVRAGAPVDVVAFADTATMDSLAEAGELRGTPEVFARNRMVVVTRTGNPDGVRSLKDLERVGFVALCVPTAPCGKYAQRMLDTAHVKLRAASVTRGSDARSTLAAVTNGDADAAIVYATDARSAGAQVAIVEVAEARDLTAKYPIAVTTGASERADAEAFVAYVRSKAGLGMLERRGFLAP